MSRGAQLQISRTKTIPIPNEYIQALYGECGNWCFDEEAAPLQRGLWRKSFNVGDDALLDWEIGTGNGNHFAHRAQSFPNRCLLGTELKYKPLIQTIRRALRARCTNARMFRYNAALAEHLFAPGELNDVFVHFPDPWSKIRQHKHRLLQLEFFETLYNIQRPGSILEIKMDNRLYFDWTLERIKKSSYEVRDLTFDLHKSEFAAANYLTQFEAIFVRQNIPINLIRLVRT